MISIAMPALARGLVHSAKVRIFNNMLHVFAIRTLGKAEHIHKRETHPLVREDLTTRAMTARVQVQKNL
jgi:hypothetical protein